MPRVWNLSGEHCMAGSKLGFLGLRSSLQHMCKAPAWLKVSRPACARLLPNATQPWCSSPLSIRAGTTSCCCQWALCAILAQLYSRPDRFPCLKASAERSIEGETCQAQSPLPAMLCRHCVPCCVGTACYAVVRHSALWYRIVKTPRCLKTLSTLLTSHHLHLPSRVDCAGYKGSTMHLRYLGGCLATWIEDSFFLPRNNRYVALPSCRAAQMLNAPSTRKLSASLQTPSARLT